MKVILHKSEERGKADYGWLKANYSFSFASWYDPKRTRFGLLRVLNDDIIAPGRGFDMHPHDNMEIITIPLKGSLSHKDSTGGEGIISQGEIQVMSAGSGIYHSEFNASDSEPLNLLQIWVLPKLKDIKPRYDQKKFNPLHRKNKFQTIVSPDRSGESLWINQDVYFSIADIYKGVTLEYQLKKSENGIYLFVIKGQVIIGDETLKARDAIGIENTQKIAIKSLDDSEVLVIDVPMKLQKEASEN